MQFAHKLKNENICIYGLNKYLDVPNVDIETSCVGAISFDIEMDMRDWGIKAMDVSINRVEVYVDWTTESDYITSGDEDTLVEKGGLAHSNRVDGFVTIKSDDKGWDVINECEFSNDGYYCINDISVDMIKKTITLS